jgi:hypothetical protein
VCSHLTTLRFASPQLFAFGGVCSLKVTLLGDVSTRIELRGTRNPAAFDAYLHATRATDQGGSTGYLRATAAYSEAVRLDANYALAFAGRSFVQSLYAAQSATRSEVQRFFDKALADAHQAIALAPELPEGHLALGFYLANGALDLKRAGDELERARALAPGRASVLRVSGLYGIWRTSMRKRRQRTQKPSASIPIWRALMNSAD